MSELSSDSETTFISQQAKSVADEFEIGQVVGGKYKIVSLLGRGGIGSVYKVEQFLLQQNFALKTLNSQKASDQLIRRFQNEARAASSLSHPNLVKVIDFGLLEGQQPYLVMDLVEGVSLSEYLKKNGSLTVDEAVSCFSQICLGLSYAHDQGIVHRDIKPGNIMISSILSFGAEGFVKVVDFGIAKLVYAEGGEVQALTTTGEIFGSPLYMSPEQCSGTAVDHRSDIYSLGCVLFEALTGTTPFVGQNALTTMMLHQSERVPSLKEASLGKEFPAELEQIVAKLLAKSPADRYQNLGVVANDLAQLAKGAPVLGIVDARKTQTKGQDQPLKMSRRELQMWFCITAIGAGLVGGDIGYKAASFKYAPIETNPASKSTQSVPESGNAATPVSERPIVADDFNSIAIGKYEDRVVIPVLGRKVDEISTVPGEFSAIKRLLSSLDVKETERFRECLDRLTVVAQKGKNDKAFMRRFGSELEERIAFCNMRVGEYFEAEKHLKLAADNCKSPLEKLVRARFHQELAAHLWRDKHAGKEAFNHHKRAAELYESVYKSGCNFQIPNEALLGIGANYRCCCQLAIEFLKDYKTAIAMAHKSTAACELLNNKKEIAHSTLCAGVAYARDNQLAKALLSLASGEKKLAESDLVNQDYYALCSARNELGAVEARMGDFKGARKHAAMALDALSQYKVPKELEKGVVAYRAQLVKQKDLYDTLSASK